MPCHAMLRYAMLRYAMLCHVMPCHAMPCHAMPRHAMPCYGPAEALAARAAAPPLGMSASRRRRQSSAAAAASRRATSGTHSPASGRADCAPRRLRAARPHAARAPACARPPLPHVPEGHARCMRITMSTMRDPVLQLTDPQLRRHAERRDARAAHATPQFCRSGSCPSH